MPSDSRNSVLHGYIATDLNSSLIDVASFRNDHAVDTTSKWLQSTCNTPSSNSVSMTIQVECITFHIDNTVKLFMGNHINLYTHNWYI